MEKEELQSRVIELLHELALLRASCSHEAEPVEVGESVVCLICGAELKGCLASPSGECHYEPSAEICIYCSKQKHAVITVPGSS